MAETVFHGRPESHAYIVSEEESTDYSEIDRLLIFMSLNVTRDVLARSPRAFPTLVRARILERLEFLISEMENPPRPEETW